MRWPRKSRVVLWRDPECASGCRRHKSQKMSPRRCPRWSHESSRESEEVVGVDILLVQAAERLAEKTGGMVLK